jgi:branched-subunit amino acid transport protein
MSLSKPTMVLLGVAAGVYLIKAAAPVFLGARPLPKWLDRFASVAPGALLAAMVLSSTLAGDQKQTLVIDARFAGVVAAGIALWRKLGFVTTVLIAVAVTAATRALIGG